MKGPQFFVGDRGIHTIVPWQYGHKGGRVWPQVPNPNAYPVLDQCRVGPPFSLSPAPPGFTFTSLWPPPAVARWRWAQPWQAMTHDCLPYLHHYTHITWSHAPLLCMQGGETTRLWGHLTPTYTNVSPSPATGHRHYVPPQKLTKWRILSYSEGYTLDVLFKNSWIPDCKLFRKISRPISDKWVPSDLNREGSKAVIVLSWLM